MSKISLTISSDDARYIVNTLHEDDEIEYQSVGFGLQKTFDSCQRFLLDRVVAVRQRQRFRQSTRPQPSATDQSAHAQNTDCQGKNAIPGASAGAMTEP